MTRDEAKEALSVLKIYDNQWLREAIDMAIEALSADAVEGKWNTHEVACLLADMFGDACACNYNGINEWLPSVCEFAETKCPNPGGVACWEQYAEHRLADMKGGDDE